MNQQLEASITAYDNGYYAKQLEVGKEFQDFVTREMFRLGWPIVGYSSRKYQLQYGENIMGAEIKRDQRFRDTGNLYIETEEKADPRNAIFVQSGIFREDNSILFIIGDDADFWILATRILRQLAKAKIGGELIYRRVEIPTSRGFLLPIDHADKYCIHKVTPAVQPGGYEW